MIKKRAKDVQKKVRAQNGIIIMRAYYGLKSDIVRYMDLAHFDSLYWEEDDPRLSENIGCLMIVNVTIPVRLNLNDKLGKSGGLSIKSSKQFSLGFYNPIPDFMCEHSPPVLYIIFKLKGVIYR